MDGTLYTLEEASKLTGVSPEALRKRFMRGQIEGIPSKQSNDGKVRIRLTEGQLSDLRRVDNQVDDEPPESVVRVDGDQTVQVLSRLADSLERRLARAEEQADQARGALDTERTARDQERQKWADRLDAMTGELTAMREGRTKDRRDARAAIERIQKAAREAREQAAGLQTTLDQVLANQAKPGILARLFRVKRLGQDAANHDTNSPEGDRT